MKRRKGRPEKNKKKIFCTWAINGFPRAIKNKFLAQCKLNNMSGRDGLEYVILKSLREESKQTKEDLYGNINSKDS